MSLMSSFKGVLGETVINVAMWLKFEKDLYHRLNNITLPLNNGGSTQIDHVIVSKYSIFVIETKNYKGWIFGNEKQRQWTQAFPNGSKYKFQNPLHQNYLHIKTLADLLALDMSYFHSMIAFIGECELKTREELPEQVLTSGMVSYIKRKQDEILSEDTVIKQNHDTLVQVPPCPNCPICNSEMVQRIAKKGARQGQVFYGCLQFPKCRGVVNTN